MPATGFVADLRKRLMVENVSVPIGRRRQIAEDGMVEVLLAIKQRAWVLDAWTSDRLTVALKAVSEGRYDDARLSALAAIAPLEERDASKPPKGKVRPLADLQAELAKVRRTAIS